MPTEFKLPDLGENIESADIVKVLVAEGDQIGVDQAVVEVETDKVTVEVPCPHAGKVQAVHVSPGDTVGVGAALITLDADSAPSPPPPTPPAAPEPAEAVPEEVAPPTPDADEQDEAPAPAAEPEPSEARPGAPAGPATRRLARELGVEISRVEGSGPGGRITRQDVVAAVRRASIVDRESPEAAAPAATEDADKWGPIRRESIPRIRQTIAEHTAAAAATIPHVTNFDDCDVTELEEIRQASKDDYEKVGIKLTSASFVVKAVARALASHPVVNASLDFEAGEVIYKDYVNIGVAVDTDAGLVVPNLRRVDQMNITQIAQSLMALADLARQRKLAVDDLRGGTFTISNLGAIGGSYATPIINAPQVAVLLVGRSRRLPVVVEDRIEPRLMMPLSLSYDHRLIDGAAAARFLNDVIDLLESPGRLLLGP